MRSPTKLDGSERRSSEPSTRARRSSETVRAARPKGEHHVGDHATVTAAGQAAVGQGTANQAEGAVVTSMVDALEDILKWERASERAMRVATEQSTTELDPSN
jgi:hypothetical protein